MTRTDIHRPSAIVPEDYQFVAFGYQKIETLFDVYAVQHERAALKAHMDSTGGTYSQHEHAGNCHICGASAIYTAYFYHEKTNTYIRTGLDCAEKLELSTGDANRFKTAIRDAREAYAGKRKAQAILSDAGLSDAWQYYVMDYEQLPRDETKPRRDYETGELNGFHPLNDAMTVRDIVEKLVKFGSISDKQMAFLGSLLKRIADRPRIMAERAAEKAAAADCPTGRVKITGTVLKVEERESAYGIVDKMTVKAREGYIVWVTKPRSMTAERGEEVEFTCTLTPSDTDPKFGFGKRPSF